MISTPCVSRLMVLISMEESQEQDGKSKKEKKVIFFVVLKKRVTWNKNLQIFIKHIQLDEESYKLIDIYLPQI